jgi:hypothetical protein
MVFPFAQAAGNTLLAVIVFTVISLPMGFGVGYLWAYRFKRQYLQVARELATVKGENFRGELSTLRLPKGSVHTGLPPRKSAPASPSNEPPGASLGSTPVANAPGPSSQTGTEAWQLAQLHKEQIAMQLRLDDFMAQIAKLTSERDQWRQQAGRHAEDVEQLRKMLAQQEAMIASVERQRDEFQGRIAELDRPGV